MLTLPGQWSLELSAATRMWSYRRSPGRADHAGRCATEHDGGITYVGLDTGHICTVNLNTALEPGGIVDREIITFWLGGEDKRQTFNSVDVTSSMGPDAGAFLLDWSVDKAVTWHGLRSIIMPQPGVRRAIARNLGSGRRRQLRLRYLGSAAPFTFDEIFVDATAGV